jgi:hypothetical protein
MLVFFITDCFSIQTNTTEPTIFGNIFQLFGGLQNQVNGYTGLSSVKILMRAEKKYFFVEVKSCYLVNTRAY